MSAPERIIPHKGEDLWELALRCDALYECPKDASGGRLGPLVPYAKKDERGRNLVGDVYFNFAMIESHPAAVFAYASSIVEKLRGKHLLHQATAVVGIPEGGRSLGELVALIGDLRFVYPKKVEKPKAPEAVKADYDLVFERFELSPDDKLIVCDDVFNNFENTDKVFTAMAGKRVTALVGALNRSPRVGLVYIPGTGPGTGWSPSTTATGAIPVITAIRKLLPEYNQDDPEVAADIGKKNIEPKVKANWSRLKEVMLKHRPPS